MLEASTEFLVVGLGKTVSTPRGMSVLGSSVVGMDQRTGPRLGAHDGAHDGVVEDDGCLDDGRLEHGSDGVENGDAVGSGVDGLGVAGGGGGVRWASGGVLG